MNKHFNIKKIAFMTIVFMCFFAFQNKVKADRIVCNYKIDMRTNDDVELTISYNSDYKDTRFPKVEAVAGDGITKVMNASTSFNVGDIKKTGSSCPQTLYESTAPYNGDTGKLFYTYHLTEASAKKQSSEGAVSNTYTFLNSTDYNSMDKCTLFLLSSTEFDDNVVQFYKAGQSTPVVKVDGKLSGESEKYTADFTDSQIATCPSYVYMTESYDESTNITTKNFTLTKPNADKYAEFVKVKINKKTLSNSGGTGCNKIKTLGKYIKAGFAILRYAFPTLIIILSIIEFLGVVLSGEDEKMEKAKKHFITRILVGILIIFLPYFLELLLHIAGVLEGDIADAVCNLISK